jgi:hypothetical protein
MMKMITAASFKKAQKTLDEARGIVNVEMPKAELVFVGADNDHLFFNVVAKAVNITKQQVIDITEKTRFQTIRLESNDLIWQAEFKMNLWV